MLKLLIIPQGLGPVASQISVFEASCRLPDPQLKQLAAKSSRHMAKCAIHSATKPVVFLCGGLSLLELFRIYAIEHERTYA